MSRSVSKSALIVLGTILISGKISAAELINNNSDTVAAARAVNELIEAGILKVDGVTGGITVQRSVLDVLKDSGIAVEHDHGTKSMEACSSTTGDRSGSSN